MIEPSKEPSKEQKRKMAKRFRNETITLLLAHRDWTQCCPAFVALLDQADAELESGDPTIGFERVIEAAETVLDQLVRELEHPDKEVVFSAAETLLKLRRAVNEMDKEAGK